MQLILDAETTIDIESNMSAINQESLDEKFASNIIDHLSKDRVTNSDKNNTEAHDNILSDSEEKEIENGNEETDNTVKSNNIISEGNDVITKLKECSFENSDNNLSDKTDPDIITENIKANISENRDVNINQENESESRSDILLEENVSLTEPTSMLDKEIVQLESNSSETSDTVKEEPSSKDIDTVDGKANESVIENKQSYELENNLKTEVTNNCQSNNTLEKDNEEQNISDTEIGISQIGESKESVCSVVSSIDCDGASEVNITNEVKEIFSEHKVIAEKEEEQEAKSQPDSQMIVSPSPITLTDNIIGDTDIKESNKEEEPVLETELITAENIIEKTDERINEGKSHSETKEDRTDVVKSKVEEKVEKSRNKVEEKKIEEKKKCKLSNTLDILSDDEDEQLEGPENIEKPHEVDDDDIMLIDEDNNSNIVGDCAKVDKSLLEQGDTSKTCNVEKNTSTDCNKTVVAENTKTETPPEQVIDNAEKKDLDVKKNDYNGNVKVKPLLPSNFLKTCKKNLADMTREDLEEFCILKIVESVVDRSNIGEIKNQLKCLTLAVEEHKKKALMLTKQNRDLQVVLKSVQEEQKKSSVFPITPLKITRSVGMQVLMTDKPSAKRKSVAAVNSSNPSNYTGTSSDKSNRNNTNQKAQKSNSNNQQIPVPRLVPAANITATKSNNTIQTNTNNSVKPQQPNTPLPNGIRNSPPAQKPEKRPRVQSVTVDLTDDEPPSKMTSRSSPAPPVRLVPSQNLMAPQRAPFAPNINSPRKVYIPISGPQAQNVRTGQTIMLKSVPPNPGLRPRGPLNNLAKMPPNTIRMNRVQGNRHPAPLPDALKQYQPPNWKALPPAPDLKLSKVENGIVISWKIDGYQDDSYEEIASYQLYAYQETTSPPSTALWKKIGDVKALPLPMACTLTQFMAGYKYYFAVRAVDVKSRLGPFSLPGSILLLNKM